MGTGAGAGAGAGAEVIATGGGAKDDELEGRGSGGDRGSGPENDEFGLEGCEESRRSPLRPFLPPRAPRPPSKLRSCWPRAVSAGRWGDGREGPESPGPRSFLFRFGGIIKDGIAEVGSFIGGDVQPEVAVSKNQYQ
jgi:hypothetical protein